MLLLEIKQATTNKLYVFTILNCCAVCTHLVTRSGVSLLELKYETENEEKGKTSVDNKSPRLNVSKYSVLLSDVRVLEMLFPTHSV